VICSEGSQQALDTRGNSDMAEGLLGLGVLPERAEIKRGLLDFLGTSPAQDDPVAAQDAPKPARNIVMDYFNTYVGPEELGASDMKRLYDSKRDAYKVYHNKGEKRPTVGKGVFLDDDALKKLGLKKVPKVGEYLPAMDVDSVSQNRWVDAYQRATKKLAGTKGESSIGPLAEMIYQMGAGVVTPGHKKHFPKTLKLLKQGKVQKAQEEAKISKGWYEVPNLKRRALGVINRFGRGDL
jgi:hypothetical protein